MLSAGGAPWRARITGCGAYLPERVVTNDELARTVDTSDAWIRERTGIAQRHLAQDGEGTAFMGARAARAARLSAAPSSGAGRAARGAGRARPPRG